jgi:hypothetical protein
MSINNMPKELEMKLKKEAHKKGLGEERTNAYVYGTMRKTGWKPSREMTKEQKEMHKKIMES